MNDITVNDHTVEITHPDKMIYPADNITKADIIAYYDKIAEIMLPHIEERALSLQRFPNGIDKNAFFQKNAPDYYPEWIETVKIKNKSTDGYTNYAVCNNKETLLYLGNQLSIIQHIWLSKRNAPDNPDMMVFDLDPSGDNFDDVKSAAKIIRKFIQNNSELVSYLKTSGSRGLHIVIPLDVKKGFEYVKKIADAIAEVLAAEYPNLLTVETYKKNRGKKVYIDTARNAFGQTIVVPFSLRAIEGAPISTPLDWDELSELDSAKKYGLKNIFRRLSRKKDPWADIYKNKQSLKKIEKELNV